MSVSQCRQDLCLIDRTGLMTARLWLRLEMAREPKLAAALLWLPEMER